VRFVVDAQLPPDLACWITDQEHNTEHVADVGLTTASDREIWRYAEAAGAVIVTKDEDFARRRSLECEGPSVVWLRFGNTARRVAPAARPRLPDDPGSARATGAPDRGASGVIQATMSIQLPDADAEIEPIPTSGGGRALESELDRFSNLIKGFNDQCCNVSWTHADRVHKLVTEEIPSRVAADTAYQNARRNSDKQNARIEYDKALGRVMLSLLKDDTQFYRLFSNDESFRKWLTDTILAR
jgi:predicted nuclease of predicted toxin-antitoxin system